jgi:hypothetical protein
MILVELARLDEGGLKGTAAGRLALALLKAVGEGRPMGWLRFRTILSDVCRKLRPDRLHRELRRALYYLLSVSDEQQEAEVRRSLQSVQDEFIPVKEHFMTLLELFQKRGRVSMLTRMLSAAFPEFAAADADRLQKLPDEVLDELADAIALRRPWAEIRKLLRRKAG